LARQENNRRLVAIFTQFVQNVAACHIRQTQIQNNSLIIINIRQLNACFTALSLIDLNVLILKNFAQGAGKYGIIINKQNTRGKLP